MAYDPLLREGFAIAPNVLSARECEDVLRLVAGGVKSLAGVRSLLAVDWCQRLATHLRSHPEIASFVPAGYVAAQCTYFEKSSIRNWLVAVHQDLSIPVAERKSAACLGGWSEKEGTLFVQAPVELLERLVAVRVHLDSCGESDGPLQVVPGTHAIGRIGPEEAASIRHAKHMVSCTVNAGDAIVMRPLLLHASSKSSGTSLRRVLHFLFGPRDLPHGLRWRHAI
jgi:hypothetical protein